MSTEDEDLASILTELRKASGKSELSEALLCLGLVDSLDEANASQVALIKKWYRSGAETYLTSFKLRTGRTARKFVIKACVPSPGAIGVQETLDQWIKRRRDIDASLSQSCTPHLYFFGDGILIEEFIEFGIAEVLPLRPELAVNTATMLRDLGNLGYLCHNTFKDFRSRGSDVVIVDFGQDLGGKVDHAPDAEAEFLEYLMKLGVATDIIEQVEKRFS